MNARILTNSGFQIRVDDMFQPGTLVIEAFLMLLGHVVSDVIVAMVDPRIKFE